MKRKFDNYLKSKLDAPQQAPPDAWENILENLPKEKEKQRPFLPFWISLLGLNSLLILVVGGGYLLLNSGGDFIDTTNNVSNTTEQNFTTNTQINPVNSSDKITIESHSEQSIHSKEKEINLAHQTISSKNNNSLFLAEFIEAEKTENEFSYLNNRNYENNSSVFAFKNQKSDFKGIELASIYRTWDADRLSFNQIFSSDFNSDEEMNLAPFVKKSKKVKSKFNPEFERFHISGFVSPVALNSFVGSSMLSNEMSDFKTENTISLAYGFKGAYSLSPKVKIRTGVSVVDFEQITKNVPITNQEFSTDIVSPISTNNINYSGNTRLLTGDISSISGLELERNNLSDIHQQAQYIEIPLEIAVELFKTGSIGISATGGGSTWLLSENKIYAQINNFTEELGRANNLNKVSFSANAGVKFDFQLFNNLKIDVEPQFKYLINPVNNIEKYTPYTLGVNAGITVSFK
ncbi:MAG: hypothetical protein PHC38_12705 [Weeksellaceae bacterium]|nr:hypothetical protein [Weeksellaceae bacterium]